MIQGAVFRVYLARVHGNKEDKVGIAGNNPTWFKKTFFLVLPDGIELPSGNF